MEINELYLKTLFCCSACDGVIAPDEVDLVKDLSFNDPIFENLDIEKTLNKYVEQINKQGNIFLKDFLNEIANAALTDDEQIKLFRLAIKMIEADNQILYSEVKFIKKIRSNLTISDNFILDSFPESEEYLQPDIIIDGKTDDLSNIIFTPFNLTK